MNTWQTQLIPYIALAEGGSFTTRIISMHTKTNIWVTEQFLPVKFKIEEMGTDCSGCGFNPASGSNTQADLIGKDNVFGS